MKNKLLDAGLFVVIVGVVIGILSAAYLYGVNRPKEAFEESLERLSNLEKCLEATSKIVNGYKSLEVAFFDIQYSLARRQLEKEVLTLPPLSKDVEKSREVQFAFNFPTLIGLGLEIATLLKSEPEYCIKKAKLLKDTSGK